jgi:hypothetical protein
MVLPKGRESSIEELVKKLAMWNQCRTIRVDYLSGENE